MSTRVPISIEGSFVAAPDYGASRDGSKYAKFTVAATDRKLEDGKRGEGTPSITALPSSAAPPRTSARASLRTTQ